MILVWLRCNSLEAFAGLLDSWGPEIEGLHSWGVVARSDDNAALEVVSRWTTLTAFESWKGAQGPAPTPWSNTVIDLNTQIYDFLFWGGFGMLVCDRQGTILDCSGCFLKHFQTSPTGGQLWNRLVHADVALIQSKLESPKGADTPFLCNFLTDSGHPFTLECDLKVSNEWFSMLCTSPHAPEMASLVDDLLALNNQLATKTRELARQNKALLASRRELKQVHLRLQQSHWHIKKIQDCLPICINCEKVKTGEHQWEELLQYFRRNSDFLTHGYCPHCRDTELESWSEEV